MTATAHAFVDYSGVPEARLPTGQEAQHVTAMMEPSSTHRRGTPEQRELIIGKLYDEVHRLNRLRRTKGLSSSEEAYLLDVKEEIDVYEAQRREPNAQSEVVQRLEALAQRVLKLAGVQEGL